METSIPAADAASAVSAAIAAPSSIAQQQASLVAVQQKPSFSDRFLTWQTAGIAGGIIIVGTGVWFFFFKGNKEEK